MRQLTYASVCSGIEYWAVAPDTDGFYKVSSYGRVARIIDKYGKPCFKLIKPIIGTIKYPVVHFSVHGKRKRATIHRVVARAFLPNPLGLPQVNHKDENPQNNHIENLEWCTESYNHRYGTLPNRQKKLRANPIIFKGKEYISIHECSRMTGVTRKTISKNCERIVK